MSDFDFLANQMFYSDECKWFCNHTYSSDEVHIDFFKN